MAAPAHVDSGLRTAQACFRRAGPGATSSGFQARHRCKSTGKAVRPAAQGRVGVAGGEGPEVLLSCRCRLSPAHPGEVAPAKQCWAGGSLASS